MAVQHRDRMDLVLSTFKATRSQLDNLGSVAKKRNKSKAFILRELIDSLAA